MPGVTITLEGCVYRQDNDGKPFVVITDANGMAGLYRSPMVVQYCFGSASHLCSWSATKGGDTYVADITVGAAWCLPVGLAWLVCCAGLTWCMATVLL